MVFKKRIFLSLVVDLLEHYSAHRLMVRPEARAVMVIFLLVTKIWLAVLFSLVMVPLPFVVAGFFHDRRNNIATHQHFQRTTIEEKHFLLEIFLNTFIQSNIIFEINMIEFALVHKELERNLKIRKGFTSKMANTAKNNTKHFLIFRRFKFCKVADRKLTDNVRLVVTAC